MEGTSGFPLVVDGMTASLEPYRVFIFTASAGVKFAKVLLLPV
jgi:hypothetical protein